MTDPAILFVKPKAINADDRRALQDAGILVVTIKDPSDVKFVKAGAEIDGSQLLRIAAQAIAKSPNATAAFGALVAAELGNPIDH